MGHLVNGPRKPTLSNLQRKLLPYIDPLQASRHNDISKQNNNVIQQNKRMEIGPLIDTNYKYRLNSLCTKAHINPVLTLSNTNKLASLQLY